MNCRMSQKVAIFLPPTVPAHVAPAHAHSEGTGAVFRLPQACCSLFGDALCAERGSKTSYAHSRHTRTGPCINKFTVCPKGHTRTNALLTVRRCCVRGSWQQNKPRTQEHGHVRAIYARTKKGHTRRANMDVSDASPLRKARWLLLHNGPKSVSLQVMKIGAVPS